MELDLSPRVIGVTLGVWALTVLMIWKMMISSEVDIFGQKIAVTIISLPIIYVIVLMKVGQ